MSTTTPCHTHTQTHTLSHTHVWRNSRPRTHTYTHKSNCTPGLMALRLRRVETPPGWKLSPSLSLSLCIVQICSEMKSALSCKTQTPHLPASPHSCTRTYSECEHSVCAHITHTPRAALLCHKKCRQQTTVKTYTHTHTRTSNELAKGVA